MQRTSVPSLQVDMTITLSFHGTQSIPTTSKIKQSINSSKTKNQTLYQSTSSGESQNQALI